MPKKTLFKKHSVCSVTARTEYNKHIENATGNKERLWQIGSEYEEREKRKIFVEEKLRFLK